MVSIDGLRADDVDDPTLELPALRGLVARGVRARRMTPVFPSVTWTCHATMVTGVSPARHGVLGNQVFDRARVRPVLHYGDRTSIGLRAESLWDVLHAAGERAAAVCWPKTRGVSAIPDNIPEFYEQELFERFASRPLWTELAQKGLPVDRYGAWSAAHPLNPMQDWLTLEAARHILAVRPPRLLLIHFLTLDSFQHDYGVGSPEARWALVEMDALLGRLVATLEALGRLESSAIMVFSDHGFCQVHTAHHLNQLLVEEGLVDLDGRGEVTGRRAWAAANGGSAYVYVLAGAPPTTAARLRERFAALKGVTVLDRARCQELGLSDASVEPMQGDLVLSGAEGVMFTSYPTPEAVAAVRQHVATHGHEPDLPSLAAAFVMAGPGIQEGRVVDRISMLDVAPTAAALLGSALGGSTPSIATHSLTPKAKTRTPGRGSTTASSVKPARR
jgi:predicted AlkP superfamily pyrophosphatase or phosphodiesterase